MLAENTFVAFTNNTAENGGAMCVVRSGVILADYSYAGFISNTATGNGGAVYLGNNFNATLNDSASLFGSHNTANRFGGVIYGDLTHNSYGKITFNSNSTVFHYNEALIGPQFYIDIPTSCDETCLNDTIFGRYREALTTNEYISTPPSRLELRNPAVCLDKENNATCNEYLVRNTMLGQEIIIDACVVDYYNQPADATQFVVSGEKDGLNITGSRFVSLSCSTFRGISITGNEISHEAIFPMNITSHACSKSNLQKISVKLNVQLSPCHPGFHHDATQKQCICYDFSSIVSCSGSRSVIKKGYWFGAVGDKITVTICPNNYCNFSCCETSNEFYELFPGRKNQCNSHRAGSACGSCMDNYTLSFDSVECVRTDKCTAGQTALVVTLSILYWVIIVVLVYIITYCHVTLGIGYLYAITYYYSILDILLSQNLYLSQGLFTTVTILSSVAKITPLFLGQLCFVQNMSGIDQQFIHYVHALAVTIIVGMMVLLARISIKFASIVSSAIIRVVCFLMLLSYTSVATTSLLLLRSLKFHNIDTIYSYLSPDIEYFHGRHLPYVIIAILCAIVIVAGLPLLLLLEPFINAKISFNKIKPLLDQFQGCYKDKYRCFAAYYMICRLVILIIIASSTNGNTTQFLLIVATTILALIQLTIQPYKSKILNLSDGFILQMIILVSIIPLIDSFSSDLLLAVNYIFAILPLITFTIMEFVIQKDNIKKIITKFRGTPSTFAHYRQRFSQYRHKPRDTVVVDNRYVPMTYISIANDKSTGDDAMTCSM